MTNSIINEKQNNIYIGLDVHKRSISVACFDKYKDEVIYETKVENEQFLLMTLRRLQNEYGTFEVGYEAGYCGFFLYRYLTEKGFGCTILAPDSIASSQRDKKKKTDRHDSINIAKSLAFRDYRPVYIPSKRDEAVRDLIRARNDHKHDLKAMRRRVLAFCDRRGLIFKEGKSHWTIKHITWLRNLEFEEATDKMTLAYYLMTLSFLEEMIAKFDQDIEILSELKEYEKPVKRISSINGIGTLTALSIVSEVGDFSRFKTPDQFASWVGVTPGEHSSGESIRHLGITKAGNSHLRHLLTESAQCYCRGSAHYKSKALKQRQQGQPVEVIEYADSCSRRLKNKYRHMVLDQSKRHNVAITAITRELCCFIWGMATGNLGRGVRIEPV